MRGRREGVEGRRGRFGVNGEGGGWRDILRRDEWWMDMLVGWNGGGGSCGGGTGKRTEKRPCQDFAPDASEAASRW